MRHDAHGYWLQEAGEQAPAAALEGDLSADVLVVGGGYTGMWAAWQIKALEPGARVVLLEADLCGHGPSGRNGGFCNSMWFALPNMRARWGDAAALAIARAAADAVAGVEEFCAAQEVDAWVRRGGYLQVSTAPAHDGAWEPAVAACRELGAPGAVSALTPAEAAERCSSPVFRGGALYPDAATVQPARLALGLRRRLREAGVAIHERSPVRRVDGGASDIDHTRVWSMSDASSAGGVRAWTERGSVTAGAAVIAIGSAAKAPLGPLRRNLTVTSSHIVLTEPVPDVLEEIGWTGGECITDSRQMIDYFRTTPDGRIAFGWGGGRIRMGARLHGACELDPVVTARAIARLREYFPQLAEVGGGRRGPVRLTHTWGGPIDVSPTHLPLVVPLAGGRAFAAAGYTGNGVGPSYMVGRALAELALDRRGEHAALAFVDPRPQRVPPEPFHWLGGEIIRHALDRKETAELEGKRPDPFSSLISRVPNLIGFHIGR